MKHTLNYTIAAAFVAALLSATTAVAGATVDKGSLGKYERQGRFLKPVMNPAPRVVPVSNAEVTTNEGNVTIDKGAVAKYVRHGRFVRPVIEGIQNTWSTGRVANYDRGVTHVHGLNGKEHKNVK